MQERNWLQILGWGQDEINDLRYVAYTYIKQGVYDIALTFFDALAVLTEPSAYDLQTMGALHLQLGHGIKALDYLDRALKLDPAHVKTKLNRAKALFVLGYKRQALMQVAELQSMSDEETKKQAKALEISYQ